MANKPKKKKQPVKKKHFGTSNGNVTVAKALYDSRLVGTSPNSMSIGC